MWSICGCTRLSNCGTATRHADGSTRVLAAVANASGTIAKALDGTHNKSKLGANAIFDVSLAVSKAAAAAALLSHR
jgi:hypothetical protein